ncbi:MAG: poly(R)-hydroxyalkanoic acid synthase subunit PhaE [Myxococcota bacterium]
MSIWQQWKRGFDRWEGNTAQLLEHVMRSPTVLNPAGQMMTQTLKMKAASDRVMALWWSMMGLPTKRDQERTLHALNQLQSRLYDLEDKLKDIQRH